MMQEGDNERSGDLEENQRSSSASRAASGGSDQRVLQVVYDNSQEADDEERNQPKAKAKASANLLRFQGAAQMLTGDHRGVDIISQGSPIIRVLSFIAGVSSASLCIFSVVNPVVLFVHPIMWVVHIYQFIF